MEDGIAMDPAVAELTEAELDALVSGAVWYAKYHQRDIPALEGDASAGAVVRREHFQSLYSGLEKLGVRVRRPAGLESSAGRAPATG